ncbi:serine hydrolase domain-containing protein [Fulvivirga lutimaris]|uniref:serine hydrolase domain-containing protein n=1 Tax=Fulvivirga lutimaris TaxID=1819566 RepID=UPI0012BC63AD|nr:serine hydrolase domain-containing protein [Fulvivirga lutimaris]MTI40498.1 class A beta-lactamase-related serine hydrolase [Fulvivirga lutimaris]
MKRILITALLIMTGYMVGAQFKTDQIRESLSERVLKTMKKRDIVGASIAVVSKDSVLWIDTFGFSDKESSIKVKPTTLFGLGSVTKVFTSTAVMQLADQNQLNIDEPLKTYLKDFNIKGEGSNFVTPRNVMTHHSGLPSDIFKGIFSNRPEDYKTTLQYINNEYMAGKPNEIRAYSNPGYTLLGHMIADVSGQEYNEYVQENIFKVLQMDNSGYNLVDEASKTYDGEGLYKKDVFLRDTPAGGMFSSAEEMTKFMKSYLNKSSNLLKTETYDLIATKQHQNSELNMESEFALGWSLSKRPYSGKILSHTGTTLYFNAALAMAPDAGYGVVILTNSAKGGWLFKEAFKVLEELAQEAGRTKVEIETMDIGSKERVKLSESTLNQYVGTYATPGAYFNVKRRGKRLGMELQGLKIRLLAVGENTFIPKIMLFGFIPIRLGDTRFYFETVAGHKVMTLLEEGDPKELMAEKLERKQLSDAWKSRVGKYEVANNDPSERSLFKGFELVEEDGLMIFKMEQPDTKQKMGLVLDIIDDKRAKTAGLGRYGGQSVLYDKELLHVFGFQLKRIINE